MRKTPMTRTIILPCYGIVVNLDTEDSGAGAISSDLHEERGLETLRSALARTEAGFDRYDGAIDAIESLILAHAVAGIDISSPAYIEGVKTAVEACANNM
jgi:hypothetical protein